MKRVAYIDDEKDERTASRLVRKLNHPGEFECVAIYPPSEISEFPPGYDAYLLDLDLTAQFEGQHVSYHGSTLAAEIRLRYQTCPLILVTRDTVINRSSWWKQMLQTSIDVDLVLFKEQINDRPDEARAKILSLIDGFQALESIQDAGWGKVLELLGAEEYAADLRVANQPVIGNNWNIPQVARWIREVLLCFPGILYDERYAAARLGIDLSAFQTQPVFDFFAPALYHGPFNENNNYWWCKKLLGLANRLMLSHDLKRTVADHFIDAFRIETGIELSPSVCIWDRTSPADRVCYVLKSPVKLENSIPYYPDNRPAIMDEARVSFTAIRTSPDFDKTLVDENSLELVMEMWD